MSLLAKLNKKCEGAEVFQIENDISSIDFKSGQLEMGKSKLTMGRALRLIKDEKIGYSTSTDLTSESELIKNALQSAKFGDRANFKFQKPAELTEVETYDPQVEKIDSFDLISMGKKAIDKLKDFNPDLEIEVQVSTKRDKVEITNSSGHRVSDTRSSFGISVQVEKVKEGDILTLWQSASSRKLAHLDSDQLLDSLIQRLKWARRSASLKTKPMPVLFTPRGAAVLLLPLWVGFNGKSVYLGTSPLEGKLGQKAFGGRFSLIDDGTLNYAPRGFKFDDEGVPTKRKDLIKEGVVKQFIYDLKTAGMAGEKSTGNGLKSGILGDGDFRGSPTVAPTTTVVKEGDEPLDNMLAHVKEGILVDQVLGLGQGNVTSGEFSNNVAVGFKIENGQIRGRVKDTMIAGNVYDLLKEKLLAIGDRAEWAFGGAYRTPAILIDEVNVVAT